MITWLDFIIKKQDHQEQLRQAEQSRLMKQIRGRPKNPALWQKIRSRLSERSKNQPGEGRASLLEEAV